MSSAEDPRKPPAASGEGPPPAPKLSAGMRLLRELAAGRASRTEKARYYEAAAEAAARNPDLADRLEEMADRMTGVSEDQLDPPA